MGKNLQLSVRNGAAGGCFIILLQMYSLWVSIDLTFKRHSFFYIIVSFIIFCEDDAPENHLPNLCLVKKEGQQQQRSQCQRPGTARFWSRDCKWHVCNSFGLVWGHGWVPPDKMWQICWTWTILGVCMSGMGSRKCVGHQSPPLPNSQLCFKLIPLPRPKRKAASPILASSSKACGRLQLSV